MQNNIFLNLFLNSSRRVSGHRLGIYFFLMMDAQKRLDLQDNIQVHSNIYQTGTVQSTH